MFEPKVLVAILRDSSIVQPGYREKFKVQWVQSVSAFFGESITKGLNQSVLGTGR